MGGLGGPSPLVRCACASAAVHAPVAARAISVHTSAPAGKGKKMFFGFGDSGEEADSAGKPLATPKPMGF